MVDSNHKNATNSMEQNPPCEAVTQSKNSLPFMKP